jgi:hypothetical protein
MNILEVATRLCDQLTTGREPIFPFYLALLSLVLPCYILADS